MNIRIWGLLVCATLCMGATPRHSHNAVPQISAEAIEQAQFGERQKDKTALIVKAEVLLDRAGFSPGVIDGHDGDNFRKALAAFQKQNRLDPTGTPDGKTLDALAATSEDPIMGEYVITEDDVKGPFTEKIPADFEAMAKLPRLDYPSPRDELAERFHMSESLLASLNPGIDFARAGARIVVTDVPQKLRHARVAKILIDKNARSLSAFDAQGTLIAFYPASIGSAEKPAPSGEFKVKGVAHNPTYHYDPRFGFKGVKVQHKLTIRPGPKKSGRSRLDRSDGAELRYPWHAVAGKNRQDRVAWVHPPHQLGCARSRRDGAPGDDRRFHRMSDCFFGDRRQQSKRIFLFACIRKHTYFGIMKSYRLEPLQSSRAALSFC
jgi:peptidoglycan hydrolase-like protein with peptidoglycan-binding domain